MFIFNLNVIFTLNFLKMTPSRIQFSPGFLQEQDFPGSNRITADHVGKTGFSRSKLLQHGSRTPPEQSSLGSKLLSSRSTLEQIPLQEILLLREILG
jgi:hypothetical protein